MRKPYTKKEEAYIRKQYAKGTHPDKIAEHLGRTPDQIRTKAARLGCKRSRDAAWKKWEGEFLKKNYKSFTNKEIGRVLNRSEQSVKGKLGRMGMIRDPQEKINPKAKNWDKEEETYLLENFGKTSNLEIALHLQRTESSVRNKATMLGLRERTSRYWTLDEDNYLEDHYETMSVQKIAKKLHRTVESVKGRAIRLNLSAYHNDCLQMADIAAAFGVTVSAVSKWRSKKGLPAKKVKRGKCVSYRIRSEEFWEWAAAHADIVPFRNYERGTLIPEPENIHQLISDDQNPAKTQKRKPITVKLRKAIAHDYSNGFSLKSLSERYGRTENSIKHILRDNTQYGIF